ncbi:MAG: DNA polymerase III subunit delta, partial [Candidatus Saccharicenans sp.]
MAGREPFFRSWEREVSLDNLIPVKFFYGQQALYLRNLLAQLKAEAEHSGLSLQLKPYFLFETDWAEILDEALSPDMFLFQARRVLVVYFPEYEEDDQQAADRAYRQFISPFQKEIERYLASPSDGVSLLVVFSGRLKKGNKLLDFFSRMKATYPAGLELVEMKTPREGEIIAWIYEQLRRRNKKTSPQAAAKLLEIVGPDIVQL